MKYLTQLATSFTAAALLTATERSFAMRDLEARTSFFNATAFSTWTTATNVHVYIDACAMTAARFGKSWSH